MRDVVKRDYFHRDEYGGEDDAQDDFEDGESRRGRLKVVSRFQSKEADTNGARADWDCGTFDSPPMALDWYWSMSVECFAKDPTHCDTHSVVGSEL